jgi:hypothetical protein
MVTPSRASLGCRRRPRAALDLADGHALHALHHHHVGVAESQNISGTAPGPARHVAAQLRGVGGFAHQVQLVVQVGVELGHHLARLQALAVGRQALDPAGHHAHQRQVVVDDLQHAGAQHLDGHLALAPSLAPGVAKCTCAIEALATGSVEAGEHLVDGLPKAARWWPRHVAAGNGGTRSCSSASSSAMSAAAGRAGSTAPGRT